MKRENPVINTSSMADIAFLLLVFFLVATSLDIDSGLLRRLPPYVNDPIVPDLPGRNVMNVKINSRDELMINNQLCTVGDIRKITREFLLNPENKKDKPMKSSKKIAFLGTIDVTMGIISIQNDRGTSYNMYIQVLNELTSTSNQLKEELSLTSFGKKYENLSPKQQKAVSEARPCIISEAEPVFTGIE